MKIIAFKRAQNHKSLHPLFITEWIDAALLPSTEGYETLIEEHFALEIAKNQERHEGYQAHLKEQEKLAHQAQRDAALGDEVAQREINREFEIFKRWKLNNKGKK